MGVLVSCALVTAAACGSSGGKKASTAKARTKVKVGLSAFISNAPLYIAKEEGYFADEGLDVELLPSSSSITFLPSLLKGDVDVLAGSLGAAIVNAIAGGSHLRIVADKGRVTKGSCSYEALLVGTPAAGQIKSVADLRGRTISYSRDQVLTAYLADVLLRSAGLSESDVKVNDLPAPAVLDALAKGGVDAALTGEPLITQVSQAGAGRILVSAEQVLPEWQFGILMYGPSLLDHDRDTGRRFMTAYLRGVRQYSKGKTTRNVALINQFTKLDPKLIRDMCLPPMDRDGRANVDLLVTAERWAADHKLIDHVVPSAQLWDGSFATYATKQLDHS